jgi:hypothetical protein
MGKISVRQGETWNAELGFGNKTIPIEWLQHVERMCTDTMHKLALKYRAKQKRNVGRTRKRWKDQLHLEG